MKLYDLLPVMLHADYLSPTYRQPSADVLGFDVQG